MHSAAGAVACDFQRGWLGGPRGRLPQGRQRPRGPFWRAMVERPRGFQPRVTPCPRRPHGLVRVVPATRRMEGRRVLHTSAPFPLPEGGAQYLEWEATVPPSAGVRPNPDAAAKACKPFSRGRVQPAGSCASAAEDHPPPRQRWVQYRLTLGAPGNCGCMWVTTVRLVWRDGCRAQNRRPAQALRSAVAPGRGCWWPVPVGRAPRSSTGAVGNQPVLDAMLTPPSLPDPRPACSMNVMRRRPWGETIDSV